MANYPRKRGNTYHLRLSYIKFPFNIFTRRRGGSMVGGEVAQWRWRGGSMLGGEVAQWRRRGGSMLGGEVAQW